MTNETKMTRIILSSRLSLDVMRPGYMNEAPDALPRDRLRIRVLLRSVETKDRFLRAPLLRKVLLDELKWRHAINQKLWINNNKKFIINKLMGSNYEGMMMVNPLTVLTAAAACHRGPVECRCQNSMMAQCARPSIARFRLVCWRHRMVL